MAPKTPTVDITVVTKNLRALHGALEHSLTIQRTRLQEIVDELVSRGSLSRGDADKLLNQLVASSKDYSQALLQVLDNVTASARKTLGGGIAPVMATAGKTAGRLAETVRTSTGLAPKPAAKRAPKSVSKPVSKPTSKSTPKPTPKPAAEVVPNEPIPSYSTLTALEIKSRLAGLNGSALQRIRDVELAGKARKSVLAELEKRLKG
jgi:hypothetical protein